MVLKARHFASLIGLLALFGLAFAWLAPAALAHDRLISSDPEDGATVPEVPEQITLVYSANIQDIAPEAVLEDESGTVVHHAAPEISGTEAVLELPDLPAGTYDLTWSVVSSDGHRIDGVVSFTAEQPSAGMAGADADADATEDATDEATAEEEATEADATEEATDEATEEATEEATAEPTEESRSPEANDDAEPESDDDGASAFSAMLPWLTGGIAVIVVAWLGMTAARAKRANVPEDEAPDAEDPDAHQPPRE